MDGLVFTPRRTDFLKDGSIFAHSPAGSGSVHRPITTSVERVTATASESKPRPDHEDAAVSTLPKVHAPQPRNASGAPAQALWAPQPSRLSDSAVYAQDDIARQIRAKFENLVRASPLPKVVEQLISPGSQLQPLGWSASHHSSNSKPPIWQQTQAATSRSAKPSSLFLTRHASTQQLATRPAEVHTPGCQLALEPCLEKSLHRQSAGPVAQAPPLVSVSKTAVMGTDGLSQQTDMPTLAAAPQAVDAASSSQPGSQPQSPTALQAWEQQHAEHVSPTQDPDLPDDAAATNPTLSNSPQHHSAEPGPNSSRQQPQQHQQQQDQLSDNPRHAEQAEKQQPATSGAFAVADNGGNDAGLLPEASSSLSSLSPSLKMDIPGPGEMLDADIMSDDTQQPACVAEPQSWQQQGCKQIQQQGPHGDTAFFEPATAAESIKALPAADSEQCAGLSAAAAEASHCSRPSMSDNQRQSAADPAQSAGIDSPPGAAVKVSMTDTSHQQLQQARNDVVILSHQPEQSANVPDVDRADERNRPAGPAEACTADAAVKADAQPREQRPAPLSSSLSQPRSPTQAVQPVNQLADMQTEPGPTGTAEQKRTAMPSAVHGALMEAGQAAASDQTAADADAAGTGAAHLLPAADARPSSGQAGGTVVLKQAGQSKRQQPSSSTSTGPASKRQCRATRSQGAGQVQPLLTAPPDVSFQDRSNLYETSRRGRIRLPPLAFWMSETKVHDRQGGAAGIGRPSASQAPSQSAKPPRRSQPASSTLTHARSKAVSGSKAQPAVSQSQAQSGVQSRRKSAPQSTSNEAQSQAEPVAEGAKAVVPSRQPPVQHSRRNADATAATTTAATAAAARLSLPLDPPSPPFPYPILAGRAAKAGKAAARGSSQSQQPLVQKESLQPQPKSDAVKKPDTGKTAAGRQSQSDAAAAIEGQAVLGSSAAGNNGSSSPAVPVTASAEQTDAAAGSTLKAGVSPGSSKLRKCGNCKNCLLPRAKHACLTLKALRESAKAAQKADVLQDLSPAPAQPKPASVDKPSTANPLADGTATGNSTAAKPSKGIKSTAKLRKGAKPAAEASKSSKPAASKAEMPSEKASKQGKARKLVKASAAGKSLPTDSGRIHAALTQAVELASDMEEPSTYAEQQEAAQALDSLKHSPVVASRAPRNSSRSAAAPLAAAATVAAPVATAAGPAATAAEGSVPSSLPAPAMVESNTPELAQKPDSQAAQKPNSQPTQQPGSEPIESGKKKRGRPRSVHPEGWVKPPATRGRGRPRKYPVTPTQPKQPSQTGQEAAASEARQEPSQAASPAAAAATAPPARAQQTGATTAAAEPLEHAQQTGATAAAAEAMTDFEHAVSVAEAIVAAVGPLANEQPGSTAPEMPTAQQIKIKVEKGLIPNSKQAQRAQAAAAKAAATAAPAGTALAATASTSPAPSTAASWTEAQRAALQKAYLTVKPSQRNFWQHVAKMVPGKTALECCNCKFDELPTPVETVKHSSRQGGEGSPLRPPALKVTAGRVKKPTAAATKQWARQVRRHQQAQEQASDDSPQPSAQQNAVPNQRSKLSQPHHNSATRTLLAAIHRQDKADKYIDRILRKQGGRLHKAKPLAAPAGGLQSGKGGHSRGGHRDRLHASNGVMTELQAFGRQQQPPDEDMYESEQDHYFSDDSD